ncbi:MAG: alpha/beta fold hydrolase [Solirubrobacteraceae bacterium]|nr:alpha/beta fold hydrolase [Solirubrobacteraceae bacterium]
MPDPLVLLHGFTQTGASWDGVRAHLQSLDRPVITPDQRGHGTAADVRPILLPAMAADAMAAATTSPSGNGQAALGATLALGGYSMGGRAALLAAQASPGRVTHLALISTTAGLDDEADRAARAAADAALADELESLDIEALAQRWAAQPLFDGQSPEVAAAAHADRLRNTPAGLAASLRGAGTGKMGSLWAGLPSLTMPSLVLVGERDEKFRAIAERLASGLPDAELVVVPGAGHAVPLEAPRAVADALEALLSR